MGPQEELPRLEEPDVVQDAAVLDDCSVRSFPDCKLRRHQSGGAAVDRQGESEGLHVEGEVVQLVVLEEDPFPPQGTLKVVAVGAHERVE